MSSSNRFSKKFDGSVPKAALKARERQLAARASSSASSAPKASSESSFAANSNNANASSSLAAATSSSSIPATGENAALNSASTARPPLSTASAAPPAGNSKSNAASSSSLRTSRANISGSTRTINHDGRKINLPSLSGDVGSHRMRQQKQRHLNSQQLQQRQQQLHHQQSHQPSRRHIQNSSQPHSQNSHLKISQPEKSSSHESNEDKRRRGGFSYPPPEIIEGASSNASKNSSAVTSNDFHEFLDAEHRSHAAETNAANSIMKGNRSVQISEDEIHTHLPQSPDQKEPRQKRQQTNQNHHHSPISPQRHRNGLHDQHHPQEESLPSPPPTLSNSNAQTSNRDTIRLMASQITPQIPSHNTTEESGDKFMSESLREAFNEAEEVIAQTMKDIPSSPQRAGQMGTEGAADDGHDSDDHDQNLVDTSEDLEFFDAPSFSEVQDAIGKSKDLLHEMSTRNDEIEKKDHVQNGDNHDGISGSSKTVKRSLVNEGNETIDSGANFTINSSAAAHATTTSIPNGSNGTPNIPTYHGAVDLAPTSLPPRPSRSVPNSNAVQPRSNAETTAAAQPEQYNRVSYGKPTAPTSNPILSTPARRPGTEKPHSMASYTPDFRERTKGDYHSNVIYSTPTSTAFAPSGKPPLQDDDDNDNGGDGNDPKTPLTTMRNLMSSISKDRSEIEGARRPLFVSDDVMEGKKNDRPMDVSKNNQLHHNAENKGEDREVSEEDDDDWDEKELVDDGVNNIFFERREINSSCLRYGSGVVFRFRFTKALTSISLPPQGETNATKECIIINEAFGQFGGGNNGENRFVISKDTTSTTSTDPASQFVCYGDVVVLRSDFSGRLLGVKKIDAETTTDGRERPFNLEVGCYRNLGRFPQADRWTILRGGANAPFVQLGSDQQPAVGEQRIPVYYGDSIILRNYWTGGILSIGDTLALDASSRFSGWSLNIITSSYQMNNGTASTEDDIPIIEYMQRHNQCRPTRKETFQIVSPDAPLCPDWVHPTGDGLDRIYLNGTYLLQRDRHQLMSEMELNLFSEVRTRSLSYDDDHCQVEHNQQLGLQPIDTQERILLDEIIGAMMGLEGHYFQLQSENENDPPHFSFVGDEIDSSLASLVSRILPLCTNFVYVNRYVESTLCYYECGVIARILCESIGYILQEYLAFVSNLNYSLNEQHTDGMKVSMSMIHVQIKPSIRTMSVLARIVNTVQGKKGGALLVSLQNLMTKHYNGDEKGNDIMLQLLNKCAAPYARMMRSWMHGGRLHDPYNEFMIEITSRAFRDSHVTIKQGMEWIDWCKVQDENVLKSISISSIDAPKKRAIFGVERHRSTSSMSAVDKVHTTGKYWRTIHACNESAPFSFHSDGNEECDDVRDLLNPLSLSRFIDHAYQKASDTLLDLLLNKYDVLSSLIFMKKYFLLDQGDFFVDFLDAAEEELVQELPNVSQGRVQNWLASSVAKTIEAAPPGTTSQENSSASHSSQLASSLRFNFKKKSLNDQLEDFHRRGNGSKKRSNQRNLSGFEALELDFESVPFPTSLVLNVQQIRSYQFVFRQIFFAKYVERQLVHMWTDHQLLKQMMVTIRREFGPTLSLRRRMIHFIQNFVYYMKFDVIEPNWRAMESKLRAAKNYCSNNDANNTSRESFPRTVDDMLMEHNQFLICVVTQCLLTNSDLIKTVTKLMTTCLLFTTEIKKFIASTKLHEYHEITRVERSKLRHGKGSKNISGAEFRAKRDERIKRCSERILGELKTPTYQHMIRRFDEVFSTHLATFMKLLKEDHGSRSNAHLTNLMMQLDYNYFVSSSISTKE